MRKAKLTPEELARISGGDMGDGKYGCDGSYRPANGLFRCMDCNTQVWHNL